ncbi:copper amine oxidase N-terminal domain-containing protein [Brevibacillus nitrificans]|uniref:copper amine oxidase N-terminal domain-containing protein n=1 Tax=Brevibacillus nitrificans TaxID=651560 RepID=UPI002857E52D|nr:copper amine oxidase N-terminal domain-containing protein [Brevibacillus nitrificans]MDR7315203.1 hypothetical protein [Brevibacillus nitrificans]
MRPPIWKQAGKVGMLLTILTLPSFSASAEMMNNGNPGSMMEMKDSDQMMMNDMKGMVPLRKTAEMMGYDVTWNAQDRMVTLKPKGMNDMMGTIVLSIGNKKVTVNGMEQMLMSTPLIYNDMTYVGADFFESYVKKSMGK